LPFLSEFAKEKSFLEKKAASILPERPVRSGIDEHHLAHTLSGACKVKGDSTRTHDPWPVILSSATAFQETVRFLEFLSCSDASE
jgi:hypothetical protein